jgi:hypothetical protein
MTRANDFGPVQLATHLGLECWQFSRARTDGLIPAPDRPRGHWSPGAAQAALARAGEIRQAAGSVPDVGAVRAAGVLSARLGAVVTPDGVRELGRRGLLPVTGYLKHWPLYDGRALESFTDIAAAVQATWDGQLRTAPSSAAYLRIRRADVDHLTRAGLLAPADWGRGAWDRRGTFSVPLYRTGDLDQLATRADIDWAAVRATRPRCRSPLAALATVPARSGGERPGRAGAGAGQGRHRGQPVPGPLPPARLWVGQR